MKPQPGHTIVFTACIYSKKSTVMITALWKEVFGTSASVPAKDTLQQLLKSTAKLPDNVFYTVLAHYYQGKDIAAIAREMNCAVQAVERWLQHGIAILKLWHAGEQD